MANNEVFNSLKLAWERVMGDFNKKVQYYFEILPIADEKILEGSDE